MKAGVDGILHVYDAACDREFMRLLSTVEILCHAVSNTCANPSLGKKVVTDYLEIYNSSFVVSS
jgi:hypothetical protein